MYSKSILTSLLLWGAATACNNDQVGIGDYTNTWVHQALSYQRQLDHDQPLSRSTFLATHNSFNSKAYYSFDPNQVNSITDQLRMDIRALELDVHSFAGALVLCHGTAEHLGCFPNNRSFRQGLEEIAQWLTAEENKNEVLILYFEEHINSADYSEAVQVIEDVLGTFVFKPQSGGCEGIPVALSKADILAADKQILLMSDGCPNDLYSSWVYGGIGDYLNGYPTGDLENVADFPLCDTVDFDRDAFNSLLVRYYEDRTLISALYGDPPPPITAQKMPLLIKCEANIIGMDKLMPSDGRLEAAIWSWSPQQPVNLLGTEDCATQTDSGKFIASQCDEIKAFACKHPLTQQWSAVTTTGTWQDGAALCAQQGLLFAVPFSGYDNELLKIAKQQAGVAEVWLNYSDISSEGDWNNTTP